MQRAAVRGEAGSGKTTLMQWLTVRAANRDFADKLQSWNRLMPFYVRLRDYADADTRLPKIERLIDSVAPNLAGIMPPGWAYRALEAGALLVIDGVDELPSARRSDFVEWLRHLCEDFPQSVIIVSSRPAALDASRSASTLSEQLSGLGFGRLELQPMSLRDSEALVAHWHTAVGRDRMEEDDRAKLQRYDVSLRKTLREKPAIQLLASNPLMCAMICALNWDRQQDLPSQRMELYKHALVLLLQSRDADRKIQAAHLATLGSGAKEAILDALAYWMLRNVYSEATRDDVEVQVGLVLKRLATVNAPAADVTQELLERSGVLRQPQHGVVDFVHRTFLEYMGARAAVESGDLGVLVERAKEESWRETIVFAAGHAQGATRDKLITELLKRPLLGLFPRAVEADITAACCLETVSANIDPKLLLRLQERGRALFPPTNFASARILGPAAALDPSPLMGHETAGDMVVAACIRCAATVAQPTALDVIVSYASIDSLAVVDELLRAWTSFDPDIYLERVIRRMPLLRNLDINPSAAGNVEALRCLQLLVVRGQHQGNVDALSNALQAFQEDHSLSVGDQFPRYDVTDGEVNGSTVPWISRLLGTHTEGVPKINRNTRLVSIADVERIAELRSLVRLRLGRCDHGVVARLAGLPRLAHLDLVANDSLAIEAVLSLPALESLSISGLLLSDPTVERPLDLNFLSRCPKVVHLELSHLGEPDSPALLLPHLSQFQSLKFAYIPLGFLGQIETASRLISLLVQTSFIPGSALRLASLTELRELDLYVAEDLELQLPPGLKCLRLWHMPWVSLRDQLPLQQIETISLNNIKGSSGLDKLLAAPSLRWLYLNDVSDPALLAAANRAYLRGVAGR